MRLLAVRFMQEEIIKHLQNTTRYDIMLYSIKGDMVIPSERGNYGRNNYCVLHNITYGNSS